MTLSPPLWLSMLVASTNNEDNFSQSHWSRNMLLTPQTDNTFIIHVSASFTYADRRRDQSPPDCMVHVYTNDRNCHPANTQRVPRRHHHRPLEMSHVLRPCPIGVCVSLDRRRSKLPVATRYTILEALFNVGLHDNLITLAHLSYFPTNKCKATRHKT